MDSTHESLFSCLLSSRRTRESAPALRDGERSWTYADLRLAAEACAARLHAAGVVAGDRVLLLLPNSAEFVVAFLGVTRLGAIAVPVDFQAGPERLDFIAQDTSPRTCLCAIGRRLPDAFPAPSMEFDPEPPADPRSLPPSDVVRADAPAVILFSAGSTGRPKGAILEHRQLLHVARMLVEVVGMTGDHRELVIGPMTHSGPWQRVTSTLLAGGCVVVARLPLSIPGLLEDVRDFGIRGFFAPPPLLRALLASPAERVTAALAGLLSIESGSAPLAVDELAGLSRLLPGVRVLFHYGLTECSRALMLDARAHPDKLHTVGLPTPEVRVAIRGDAGEPLGPGARGEILLDAPRRIRRYWNRPDLDAERIEGGWLRTGDVGSLDPQGFLTYHGRQDDLINCGGLSFFPAEAERELGPVPGVAGYIIAGVPDPRGVMEHVPWAFVVPADPASWSPAGFSTRARERLMPHMVPRRVVVLDEIPLIVAGKPDRRRVVAEHGPASIRPE